VPSPPAAARRSAGAIGRRGFANIYLERLIERPRHIEFPVLGCPLKGHSQVAIYEVKSEVTGAVSKIVATVGDKLEPGDTVMIVESMKMEIPVIAEDGGTVKELLVAEGNAVTEGQAVAALEV